MISNRLYKIRRHYRVNWLTKHLVFIELMRNIRASSDKKGNGDEMNFIPLSFPNMI